MEAFLSDPSAHYSPWTITLGGVHSYGHAKCPDIGAWTRTELRVDCGVYSSYTVFWVQSALVLTDRCADLLLSESALRPVLSILQLPVRSWMLYRYLYNSCENMHLQCIYDAVRSSIRLIIPPQKEMLLWHYIATRNHQVDSL